MSAWSYLAARASRWMSPRSSNPSRRSSEAKAAENPISLRRASRTSIKRGRPRNDSNGPSARNLGPRADDMDLGAWRRRIREYDEITNVGPIIRRYFVIGAFDGALTVLPSIPFAFFGFRDSPIAAIVITFVLLFVIGAYLGNLVRERVIVTGLRSVAAGLGTAVLLWLMGAHPI